MKVIVGNNTIILDLLRGKSKHFVSLMREKDVSVHRKKLLKLLCKARYFKDAFIVFFQGKGA